MIDSRLRAPFQSACADPLVARLRRLPLAPLHLTGAALGLGALTAPALAFRRVGLAATTLILSGCLDVLDGSLARASDLVSDQGAALDIISDRVVEFSVILGLFLYEPKSRALPCLLMLGSVLVCVTSFLVVGIFQENSSHKSFHYSPGLMERTEAFLFFELMILFPAAFQPLAAVFTVLVFLTAAVRAAEFCRRN